MLMHYLLMPIDAVDNILQDWVSGTRNLQEASGLKHVPNE
ncbi:hypothetical protein MEA186_20177 [Mesorhizobium amorphae CCNWGS0123]|uniref:Uncharacterized protein n=1 Tax=Mesorhizobium amorphae CCNWGS0123 TaxID=1082933 RepID=G6YDJ5_9HYPH|nr:hypothetical protein MEA186_20177 [Mesorhizobium amorphae CCNWGS0123]